MEFSKLQEIIGSEVASQKHLDNIRRYNHAMVGDLNSICPLAGRTILDLGASVHGYALEAALSKGVHRYEGVDLGIERHWKSPGVEFVGDNGNVGRLTQMNADRLEFPEETFDCILTISTFEHFLNPESVLAEMHRVLRPGGIAFVVFEPIWTSSYGHHLHHFGPVSRLVPDWGHLYLTEAQMHAALASQAWPDNSPVTVDQTVHWIYHDSEINRFDIRKLKDAFRRSPFDIVRMCELRDEKTSSKLAIAEYLTRLVPYNCDELMTKGLSLLLAKGPFTEGLPRLTTGWHAVEICGSDWWCWTPCYGEVHITARNDCTAYLRGQLYSMQLPNTVDILVNGECAATIEVTWDLFGEFPPVVLSLRAGGNVVGLASRNPAVTLPDDGRPLAVAVKNLSVRVGDDAERSLMPWIGSVVM